MSRPHVFVSRKFAAAGLDRIVAACDADIWEGDLPPARDVMLQRVQGCHGLLTMLSDTIDAELMDAAGAQLRVVSNYAVGFNNIDLQAAADRSIVVGNTPDVLTDATADMAFALLMAAARRIIEGHEAVRNGAWMTWEPLGHIGQDLAGKTVGVVGLGRIGYAFAQRCHGGWGMQVLYHDHFQNERAEETLAARQVDFDTLLAESDFVSVHVDLNPSTRGMFDSAAFEKMKPTAIFVNTARGEIHNQEDLFNALSEGAIFAAGLDVTTPEPIPADDPLLTLSNCVIAPHIASATVSSRNAMAEIAADNLLAGLEGQPLRCPVRLPPKTG